MLEYWKLIALKNSRIIWTKTVNKSEDGGQTWLWCVVVLWRGRGGAVGRAELGMAFVNIYYHWQTLF